MRLPVLLGVGFAILLSAQEPLRVAFSGRPSGLHEPAPALDQGYLFYNTGQTSLALYDAHNGALVYNTSLKHPRISDNTRITNAALNRQGTAAFGVAYLQGENGHIGGLAFLDKNGAQIRFAETGNFMPCHLTYDAKGALWAFGNNASTNKEDYAMARRFDSNGKQTGAFLMRSTFAPGLDPFTCNRGLWTARAAGDRVGAMAEPQKLQGKTTEQQWVELDLDGKEIGRWTLGDAQSGGMAYTEDGRLFAKFQGPTLELNRAESRWKPAQVQYRGLLLGAEGNDLVYEDLGGLRLNWIRP